MALSEWGKDYLVRAHILFNWSRNLNSEPFTGTVLFYALFSPRWRKYVMTFLKFSEEKYNECGS